MLLAPAGFRESMRFTMMQLRKHMIGSPEELRAAVGATRLPIMQTVLVPLDASDDGMQGLALVDRVSTFSFMYRWNEEGDVTEFRWLRLDEDEVDPRALEIGRSILDLEADCRTRLGPFPGEDNLDRRSTGGVSRRRIKRHARPSRASSRSAPAGGRR